VSKNGKDAKTGVITSHRWIITAAEFENRGWFLGDRTFSSKRAAARYATLESGQPWRQMRRKGWRIAAAVVQWKAES
jgi:hypothetical protein